MNKSKITILVPIYNVEKYVAKCLSSLLNQTFKDFEVWAVVDGSPDSSAKVVKKYCKKDKRIKLIEKENGGYGSVLQYGVENIKTKYFLVCDPDDWLSEDALQKLYRFSEENNLDVAVADRYNVYEGESPRYIYTFKDVSKIKPRHVYTTQSMIQKFAFGLVSPHAKLFKTKVAKNIKFPFHVSYTDFVLYVMSLSNSQRVAYLDEALAYYLTERPGNTRTDLRPEIIFYYLEGWTCILNQLNTKDVNQYPLLILRLLNQLLFIMREYKKVTKCNFDDKEWNSILMSLQELRKYYNVLNGNLNLNFKSKIKIRLLLKSKHYKIISKYLVRYKY